MRNLATALIAVALALATWGATARAAFSAGTDSSVPLADPPAAEGFTVAILADRTTGDDDGLAVLERAVDEINRLRPAFVVHIGDLTNGYIRDMDAWRRDAQRVRAILDRLQVPFYPLAGNHDVVTGTGDPGDRRGEEIYKQFFGPLYYSFDYGDAHFICLYSDEALQSRPKLSAAQLAWLEGDLEAAAGRRIFLFVHKPLWEYEGSGWDRVLPLLAGRRVEAAFAGHFHHYYKAPAADGFPRYVLGVTGGRLFSPEEAGGLEHYCLLRVEPAAWTLALVRPGSVLADDFIDYADYRNMEELRRISFAEKGIASSVASPEAGAVDDRIHVRVANPLGMPMRVTVRGAARGGAWRFRPPVQSLILDAGAERIVAVPVSSPQVTPQRLRAPEVEVQYDYVDARGRTVPVSVPRRVPLRRVARAPLAGARVSVDGRADEPEWAGAALLSLDVWSSSPYETGQRGPDIRLLPTPAGIYLHARAQDEVISGLQADRMLSDAVFLGALADAGALEPAELNALPVVIVVPFHPSGRAVALQAFWDPREPVGTEAAGVHAAAVRTQGGWQCEAFVPWDALLPEGRPVGDLLLNAGAWDNDGDLFTELRSWAPTDDGSQWGRLLIEAQPVR